MAFDKKLLADSVVTRLIEGQGIYQFANRSFDGLVRPGATSVDIPKLGTVLVKTAGVAVDSADRMETKTDTTMMNIPLTAYSVPLADSVAGMFESGGQLIQKYIESASLALAEHFDTLLLTEAQTTNVTDSMDGATMAWSDIVAIQSTFDANKVPKQGRVICIPGALAGEFFNIDVVKSALGFNPQYLETGSFYNFMGMKFFISGLIPQINANEAVTAFYGPGLAFVINKLGDIQEAWDTVNLQKVYDVLAHAGTKLLDVKFAVTRTAQ